MRLVRPVFYLLLSALAVLALSLSATSSAFADYIEPGSIKLKTKRYSIKPLRMTAGIFYYDFSWQGIPMGEGQVKVILNDGLAQVEASAKTAKFVDVFYKLRHTSKSNFNASTFRPISFSTWQRENSREKRVEVLFSPEGVINSKENKRGKLVRSQSFSTNNFTLDPITASFVARSLPIEIGKRFDFDVFNGKHRYLISFLVEGLETIIIRGQELEVFRVIPSVEKLTDTEGEKRLESATLWITADDSRQVVRLESKVFVGSVQAEIKGFRPLLATAPKERPREVTATDGK